jgi:MoaA/NifB/PqqE/SkfB family radical SAM enzyme
MYRGRAAKKLAQYAPHHPWASFTTCPHENLRAPGRAHLDALGNVHICQGISLGNIFHKSLSEICASYDPDTHPITAPILRGGPAELARAYGLEHREEYADACHLCYESRLLLRVHFPAELLPDQMYGN